MNKTLKGNEVHSEYYVSEMLVYYCKCIQTDVIFLLETMFGYFLFQIIIRVIPILPGEINEY